MIDLSWLCVTLIIGKGGKNYKKGKKRDEGETRRDLIYKEDGQGMSLWEIFF